MKSNITDLKLTDLDYHIDLRGGFIKNYTTKLFPEFNISNNCECFYSISKKNVFRGFHYQTVPYECEKLVTCIQGQIFDVVIDLRKESPSYLLIQTFQLTDRRPQTLLVPKGCLHGFLTLSEQSIVQYFQSGPFNKEHDQGFHWKSFDIQWPISESFILSEKDQNLFTFDPRSF